VTPKLYKAGEVCEATGLQPYVLRSWEKEFPGIGVQKSPETPRVYRQSDVEQVLQIKQLVFGEGLTLAGARRRLEEIAPKASSAARDAEIAEVLDTLGADARDRIALVRSGLRSILDVLSADPGTTELAPMRIDMLIGRNGSGRNTGSGRSGGGPSGPPRRAKRTGAKGSKSKRRTERF
jgi:DNA-binding transcriptional MerR regulator